MDNLYQAIRCGDEIKEFVVTNIGGKLCVFLSDIKDVFPNTTCLMLGNKHISFVRDESGVRVTPLRIEVSVTSVLDAFVSNEASMLKVNNKFEERSMQIESSFNMPKKWKEEIEQIIKPLIDKK